MFVTLSALERFKGTKEKQRCSEYLSTQAAWKKWLGKVITGVCGSSHRSIIFQARRWQLKFSDEGKVSEGMKPLGQKPWSYGEKKMGTKLEETYTKTEGEERRMEASVNRDSSGRSFVEYKGRDLALNKYWNDSRYIKTVFPLWLLADCCTDSVFVEGVGRLWTLVLPANQTCCEIFLPKMHLGPHCSMGRTRANLWPTLWVLKG